MTISACYLPSEHINIAGESRIKNALAFFAFVVLFKTQVYFLTIGNYYPYEFGVFNPYYWAFILTVFLISVSLFLVRMLSIGTVTKPGLVLYFFIHGYLSLHFIWFFIDYPSGVVFPVLLYQFILLTVPAILILDFVDKVCGWGRVIAVSEAFFFLISMYLVVVVILDFIKGEHVYGLNGASGQLVSYLAAYSFGFLLFSYLYVGNRYKFKIFQSFIMKSITPLLLISLVMVSIINGGRGAFILILLYSAILLVPKLTGIKAFLIVLSIGSIFFLSGLSEYLSNDRIMQFGVERIFQFISLDSSDSFVAWETGTSGRGDIYSQVIHAISNSPIFGYGVFTHWEKITYPHNLFLDMALQFGLIFPVLLLFGLFFYLVLITKTWDTVNHWFFVLFLGSFVTLMFSGGYLSDPVFWFAIMGYIYRNRKVSAQHKKPFASLRLA